MDLTQVCWWSAFGGMAVGLAVGNVVFYRRWQGLRFKIERIRQSCDYGQTGHWWVDLRTGRFVMGPTVGLLLGLDEARRRGGYTAEDWYERVDEEQRETCRRAWAELVGKPGARYDTDVLMRSVDGQERWLGVLSKVVEEGPGKGHVLVGTMRDVSERVGTERAMRELSQVVQSLLDNSPSSVWAKDRDRRCLLVSRSAAALHGYAPETFYGRRTEDVVGGQIEQEQVESDRRVLETGEAVICERTFMVNGQMRSYMVTKSPHRDGRGRIIGLIGYAQDITGYKRAEARVRASEERYRAIVESQQDMICRYLPNGQLTFVNRAYAEAVERTPGELLGTNVADLVPESERRDLMRQLREHASRGGRCVNEQRVIMSDGAHGWQQWVDYALCDETGKVVEFQSVGRDITERRRAEERLKLTMAELDHRVKNNLAAVLAIADRTRREVTDLDEFYERFAGRIEALARTHHVLRDRRTGGAELRDLIEQVLEPFMKMSPRCVDIGVEEGAEGEGVRGACPDADVRIPARAVTPIALALYELASNAVKYGALSVEGGCVRVRWEMVEGTLGERVEGERIGSVRVVWEEYGGPEIVEQPSRRGFGSDLIEHGVPHELQGTCVLEFLRAGVRCVIEVPGAVVQEVGSAARDQVGM